MARYGFTSVGAAGGNAIQQFLVQRALQQRQMQMDAIAQQQREEQTKQHAADLELRTGQERRIAQAQQAQMEDLANQREFGRATTISENAMPGDVADETTRALLEKQGYGGQVKKVPGVVSQGAFQGNDANEIPQYDVNQSPDTFQMRGGSKYLSARAAADEREAAAKEAAAARSAEAEKARTAADDRAESDRAMRLTIAQLAQSGNAAQRDLANQLTQLRIDAERDKQATTREAKDKTTSEAQATTQRALDLATRLETHPGISKATGAYEMRGFTQEAQDYNGIRDQLVAALTLPNLGALKGPMSDKDVAFVKTLATRLGNTKLSEAETRLAIKEAKDFLANKLRDTSTAPTATTGTGGGGGGRVYYDANGNQVKR